MFKISNLTATTTGDVVIEMMVWGGGSDGGSDGVSAGISRLVCCAGGTTLAPY